MGVGLLSGAGDGSFTEVVIDLPVYSEFNSHSLCIADLDGNETRDIAMTLQGSGASGVLLNVCCPADISHDREVSSSDLLLVLGSWGSCPRCEADLDGDGFVGASDLIAVLTAWGACVK